MNFFEKAVADEKPSSLGELRPLDNGSKAESATKCLFLQLVAFFISICSSQAQIAPQFHESFKFSLGNFWCENHLSVADLDGDGRRDIVVMATALLGTNGPPYQYQCRAVLLHAELDGSFTDSVITSFPGRYGYGAVSADLNNDGATDLILREQSATHVLLNDGHGAFRETWSSPPGYYNLTTVDVNRDGFLDIISGTQTGNGGLIELFTNNAVGTNFRKAWASRLYGSGYDSISTVLAVNLNDDGRPDIAAREIYGGRLVTLFGTATGDSFVERSETLLGDRAFALAAGRVNGDKLDDLAVYVGWGQVRVMMNQGNGSMSNYWESPNFGEAAFNLALADFDRDGFDDIFAGTFRDGALRIFRNKPGAGFEPWWQGQMPGAGYTGTVADIDGDGSPDLIVGEKNSIRVLINQNGRPLITSLTPTTNGMAITWTGVPGKAYRVQIKTYLKEVQWTDLSGDVVAVSTHVTMTDVTASASARKFYRVVELP